jgi:ABC-2 type transport system ATP-binding protein
MNAIKTVDLNKKYSRSSGYRDLMPFRKKQWIQAVENVNLDVRQGEFFGLLGPNGAGKTTLIKLLCCLVIPTSGAAQVFGYDILKAEMAVKKLVGLVSIEERSFFWRLTGRENLRFYAALYQLYGRTAARRINELLEMVHLEKEADIRFQNYSTGMRQRLAIARGLLSQPKLLFVDEPTRSLDPVNAQAVRVFLKDIVKDSEKTVVLATHNLTEAEQLCDRLAIMNHGRIVASGSISELRSLVQKHEECRLRVRCLPEAVLPRLERLEGVLECCLTRNDDVGSSLELKITDRSRVLPLLIKILVDNGAEVYDCELKELPLEDIFSSTLKQSSGA